MTVVPQQLTDGFLDAKRWVGDPLADQVVATLIDSGEIDQVDRQLLALLRDDQLVPASLPTPVRAYFQETEGPLDVDPDALRRAQNVFATYGPEILMVLGFYSLPAAYAAHKGVQVLYHTAFLDKRPTRRVLETSRMLAAVMAPEGLAAAGTGLRTIQKVRLMHAGIRHLLQTDKAQPWDKDVLGVPINQEDLAGTLMTFSFLVISGLEQLHLPLPADDATGYLLTWSAIGRLMGVDDDLIPGSMGQAEALTRRIRQRQIAGSPEGVALTRALIDGYAEWCDRLPRTVPASMVHFFLDDDALMHQNVAAMLEVPSAGWLRVVPTLLVDFLRAGRFLLGGGPMRARVARWISRHVVAGLMRAADARGATFSIPDHLYDDWKLPVRGAKV